MPNCVVPSCCNRTCAKSKRQEEIEKHTKITFHRFPKAEERKLQWAKAIGLELSTLHRNIYICSLHFPEESFDRTSLACVRIRDHATPCINRIHVSKLQTDYSSSNENQVAETLTSENVPMIAIENKELVKKIISSSYESLPSHHDTPKQQLESQKYEFNTPKRRCVNTILNESTLESRHSKSDASTQTPTYSNTVMVQERTDDIATAISSNQSWETPRKTLLRKAMEYQKETSRKQIQALKKQNQRQKQKIAELKSILRNLKAKNLIVDK